MKRFIKYIAALSVLAMSSCDYLDIVPDNIPTIDMVFETRANAEKMLFTCYGYMPVFADHRQNPGFLAGDEMWNCTDKDTYYTNQTSFYIGQGLQNSNKPYLDYWSGGQDGRNMWIAIRDCNTFIENVDLVPDLGEEEKIRWKAEVMVLKAFYHYWMLQLYGPIPFIEKNLDVSASPEEVRIFREPVDQVVDKIVNLLDEAIALEGLPLNITVVSQEMGRLTLPAALAIKAKVLTLAASPLFNGNPDFANYTNQEGVQFINSEYSREKWVRAANACKEAIESALSAGHDLYEFDEYLTNLSETTILELTLRNIVPSKFNRELIWGCSNASTIDLMKNVNTSLTAYHQGQHYENYKRFMNPTLDVVEEFYSNHGVPIDEDIEYPYEQRYEVADAPANHEYYVESGARTANLHYFREPRFYAFVGFDRGKWFNMEVSDDENAQVVRARAGEVSGRAMPNYSVTGYFAKKLVSYKLVTTAAANNMNTLAYSFPIIRLADLYLLYAEALNETMDKPDNTVYEYVQKVRDRAGLDKETGDLVATWQKYSKNPTKPETQDGMREIIRQERLIELSFEAQRFYDIRRWRLGTTYFNRPIRGWNVSEKTETGFYQPTVIFSKSYTPKDYFWPIKLSELYINRNLVQSPMW
ncbi:MAG: RagB/SusD family nutrient uptake outer membrane protein [Candidatus Cryptobacteroides sp.]